MFLGTTLGSWLMGRINPVTVLYMGVALFVITSVPTILLFPPEKPQKSIYDDVRDPRQFPDSAGDGDDENTTPMPSRQKQTLYRRFVEQARSKQNLFASVKKLLFEQKAVRNALLILLFHMISRGVRMPFQTWVSKRYSWTLSKTGIILSFESLIGAGALLLLPFLRTTIAKTSKAIIGIVDLPPDLLIAALSLCCQVGSSLLYGFTSSEFFFMLALVVNAPARAFFDGLRAHCIALGQESDIMLIHMAFIYVEIMSGIVNGPLWIKIYAFTYSDGNKFGLGFPFVICLAITVATVFMIPLARGRKGV
ncbi:hypothetical protein ABW20_dc0104199 [Dactylellina cionopaga]|nr:hypothetical protein ABW20_dc0104199 [Dactylellina cionopaga]